MGNMGTAGIQIQAFSVILIAGDGNAHTLNPNSTRYTTPHATHTESSLCALPTILDAQLHRW